MARDKRAIDERRDSLIEMTSSFCEARLDDEYRELCERLIRKMSRKRSVPFLRGRLEIWAAAVVCAVGQVNFLFDKSFEPHASADDICGHFGAKKSTVSQKAKAIRDMFKMDYWNPEFSTSQILEESPLKDLMMVDGLIIHQGGLSKLFEEAARFAGVGEALRAATQGEISPPVSAAGWLEDVAGAYREALRAGLVGEKIQGRTIEEKDLFHLAPHIFLKWRGGDLPPAKRDEVVKMTLRNYLATLEHAEGGADLERSPLLSFVFCWLVAHMMAGLLDEDSTHLLLELCVLREDDLAERAGAGS